MPDPKVITLTGFPCNCNVKNGRRSEWSFVQENLINPNAAKSRILLRSPVKAESISITLYRLVHQLVILLFFRTVFYALNCLINECVILKDSKT